MAIRYDAVIIGLSGGSGGGGGGGSGGVSGGEGDVETIKRETKDCLGGSLDTPVARIFRHKMPLSKSGYLGGE